MILIMKAIPTKIKNNQINTIINIVTIKIFTMTKKIHFVVLLDPLEACFPEFQVVFPILFVASKNLILKETQLSLL